MSLPCLNKVILSYPILSKHLQILTYAPRLPGVGGGGGLGASSDKLH